MSGTYTQSHVTDRSSFHATNQNYIIFNFTLCKTHKLSRVVHRMRGASIMRRPRSHLTIIFVSTGWLKSSYRFLFIPFCFEGRDLCKRVILLDHVNTDLAYQQHLREWNILLSEPISFSYNHTLSVLQCLFFKQ